MIFFNHKKFNHGIEVHYNVLSKKEIKNLLSVSKSKLYKIGYNFPGLQSDPNFHLHISDEILNKFFKKVKNKNISKCWVNYTDYDMKYESWHDHIKAKNTCVYMIENPEKMGTMFKINGKIYQIDMPTNSLTVFPSHLIHTVPYNIKNPRYSLAMDFN
jgi:hypothetical protein